MPKQLTPFQQLVRDMKPYEVVKMDGKWGTLKCPQKDCKGTFKVERKRFKESRRQVGRSCPYCFKVSAVPGREITEDTVRHQEEG